MPEYPHISGRKPLQTVTAAFQGLNGTMSITDGEFSDMQNLTSDGYPLLASRPKRGTVYTPAQGETVQAIHGGEKLLTVTDGIVRYDGQAVNAGTPLLAGEKQLLSFGAYVLIWPDKWYFNTADLNDRGYMEASVTAADAVFSDGTLQGSTAVYNTLTCEAADFSCFQPGDAVVISGCSEQPQNNKIAVIEEVEAHTLRFAENTFAPYTVRTCHIKKELAAGLYAVGSGEDGYYHLTANMAMAAGDTLIIAHGGIAQLAEVWRGDELIFTDTTLYSTTLQTGAKVLPFTLEPDGFNGLIGVCEDEVTLARSVPDMDYVCQAQNRVWGCRYGWKDGELLNEIYASKLGDFKNWNVFRGISTDSYRASSGAAGRWTGAIAYNGYPLFFKENHLTRVYPSASGAHQLAGRLCPGVRDGCARSLAVVGDAVYYVGCENIYAYQGGAPYAVGEKLGDFGRFRGAACAGSYRGKYYLSIFDSDRAPAPDTALRTLYVYDTARRLWHIEDGELKALAFAGVGGELYALTASQEIKLIRGNGSYVDSGEVSWYAVTGLTDLKLPGHKTLSRLLLRLSLAEGASADAELQYDSGGVWQHIGHIEGGGTKSVLLPVRPLRGDHFKLRLSGTGELRLYAVTKIYKQGSEEQCRFR